jgi:hypothetical protein
VHIPLPEVLGKSELLETGRCSFLHGHIFPYI